MSPRKAKTDPEIIEMPDQKMAVVTGKGAPDEVFPQIFPLLYGAVYALKFDLKKRGLATFKVAAPRARYPDAWDQAKKDQWTIIIGIPIPDNTRSFTEKASPEVKIETWHYGAVAQILHLGPYDQETPTIQRLHQFIADSGYEIAGSHEEEYLSRPDAKVVKTIIRYAVKKKG